MSGQFILAGVRSGHGHSAGEYRHSPVHIGIVRDDVAGPQPHTGGMV